MRNVLFSRYLRFAVCVCVLCSVVVCLTGCNRGTPGETAAEVNRRHIEILRNDALMMQDDIDTVLMLEKPSKLSDRHIR